MSPFFPLLDYKTREIQKYLSFKKKVLAVQDKCINKK